MKDALSHSLSLLPLTAIEALLELFSSQDAELNFPGVSPAALQTQLELIQTKNDVVSQAEAALANARDELAIAGDDVLHLAKKAHAYLSVYAQDNPALIEELSKVKLSDDTKSSKVTRKKRPAATPRKTALKLEESPQQGSEILGLRATQRVTEAPTEKVALEGVLAAE